MKPIFHRKVQKFIRTLRDEELRRLIQKHVDTIIADPGCGKLLEHPFRRYTIRSYGCTYQGNAYRIAYTEHRKAGKLVFLLVDVRENVYEKLKKMMS